MDRCRCKEYTEAVKSLKFYTVGTLRPDAIENYDRSGYAVVWIKHGVDYNDMKFSKPKAWKLHRENLEHQLPEESRRIKEMWCPFMTPIKQSLE